MKKISSITKSGKVNVIPGNKICNEEKKYIKSRNKIVKKAIIKIIGLTAKIKNLPKIDICFSGGGYRSMINSIAFLNAAEQINLFQASRYISTLSGSSWLLIVLLVNKAMPNNYTKYLRDNISNDFLNSKIFKDAIKKYQSTNDKDALIASWGEIVSKHLLNKNKNLTLKEVRKILNETTYYPFPIFSCTIANSLSKENIVPYSYLEINPYTTYSKDLGGTILTKSLGNKFNNGLQITDYPELELSFLMGILGSSFCMSVGDFLSFWLLQFGEKFNLKIYKHLNWLNSKFKNLDFYNYHPFAATIPNYSYKLTESKLKKTQNLELIDGGFLLNLPIEALFRRKSDIIIICDSSIDANDKNKLELQLAANYALDHGIDFPNIDKPYAKFDNLKIFFNPNHAHIPMIIYFTNPIESSEFKLKYSSKDFDMLYNSMQKVVLDNTKNITNAIKLKTKQLN